MYFCIATDGKLKWKCNGKWLHGILDGRDDLYDFLISVVERCCGVLRIVLDKASVLTCFFLTMVFSMIHFASHFPWPINSLFTLCPSL